MQDKLIFLIGPPRSGSTLLSRILGAHSAIHSPAEPHLLTPLAHLGYYARVDEAPYDPIIAQAGIQELVPALPRGEADYLDALRAYSDHLYGKLLEGSGRVRLLDKTPAYALVLDFAAKLYPEARYLVLTRHPMAIWSSYVESFFDGDPAAAHQRNPLLERYVPAMARFLRKAPVPLHHIRYEELVNAPREQMQAVCSFLDLPFEEDMVEYGRSEQGRNGTARGLGDPVTVSREQRPTTRSVERWIADLAGKPQAIDLCEQILAHLTDEDLATWGFTRRQIAEDLAGIDRAGAARRSRPHSLHALERRLVVQLRRNIHENAFGRLVRRIRWACDVLLR